MTSHIAPAEGGLVRRASVYLLANVANALLPFALLPVLVRELGPAEYGTLGLFTSSLGFFSVVLGLGGVGYARASYHKLGAEEYRAGLGAVLGIFFAATAVAVLGLAGAIAAGLFESAAAGASAAVVVPWPVLALGLLGGACQFAFTLRLALWQMGERPAPYGRALLAATALSLLLSLVLVFGWDLGWQGRAWGVVLPLLLLGGGAVVALLWRGEARWAGARAMLPRVLAYSLPLVPHALAASAIPFCERSALAGSAGLAEAGLFFAAFQLALPVRILANSINLAFKPWSYRQMALGEQGAVVRGSYAAMGVLTLAALAWAVAVAAGFELVAGPALAGGRTVALWLIASGLLSGFYLIVVKGLMFAERTRALMFVSVPLSAAYCAAVFRLETALQVAQASVLYQACLFLAVWLLASRLFPQPWLGGARR